MRRMGLRLFRRIKIAPGISLNLSKSGISTSVGVRGAHLTVGPRGVRRTVGLPGTGVYYTSTSSAGSRPRAGSHEAEHDAVSSGTGCLTWIVALVLIGLVKDRKSTRLNSSH